MSQTESFRLPAGFEMLESFVERWALPTTAERVRGRLESDEAARISFYCAASGKLADALALLDGKPLGELDDRQRNLMNLMLSLAHVSIAVEVQKDQEAAQAKGRQHIRVIASTADRPA